MHVRKGGCALIKRILLLLTVALVMALMTVASTLPAFAYHAPANDEHANCLGAAGSDSSTNEDPRATGESRSYYAQQGEGRNDSFAHGVDPETGEAIEPGLCVFEAAP